MNITDGLRGRPALSPIAAAAILTHADLGVEPIVQVVARSRARNALIADLLGASALGVRNLLCMTGDVPEGSADVQDVDVFALIEMAARVPRGPRVGAAGDGGAVLCRRGVVAVRTGSRVRSRAARPQARGGRASSSRPSPCSTRGSSPRRSIACRVALADLPLIVGLAPVRSCDHARRLTAIPGIVIPARLLAVLEQASDDADACERYWAYLDEELDWLARNAPLRGFHLMPIGHSKRGIRQTSTFDRLYAAATKVLGVTTPSAEGVASTTAPLQTAAAGIASA